MGSFDLTVFKEAIMATFEVIHQRYSDAEYVRDYVEAASELEASKQVWPKYPDELYCWCCTTELDFRDEEYPF